MHMPTRHGRMVIGLVAGLVIGSSTTAIATTTTSTSDRVSTDIASAISALQDAQSALASPSPSPSPTVSPTVVTSSTPTASPSPSPSPTPTSALKVDMGIGPNGLRWATRTPSILPYDTITWTGTIVPATTRTPDVTVTSASALLSALKSSHSGEWIHASKSAASNWGDLSVSGLPTSGFATNVVIDADPGLTLGALGIYSPNTSWVGFTVTSSAYIHPGADNTKLIRILGTGAAQFFTTSANDTERVECVAPDRPATQTDRGQIKAYNAPPPNNYVDYGDWFEGTDPSSTSTNHGDTFQWMAMTGLHVQMDSYYGAASNNGTTQIKNEFQGTYTNPTSESWTMPDGTVVTAAKGAAYGTFARYDSLYRGAIIPGQANSTSQVGKDVSVNSFYTQMPNGGGGRLLINRSDFAMHGNVLQYGAKFSNGTNAQSAYPDNTYGAPVVVPAAPSHLSAAWVWWN